MTAMGNENLNEAVYKMIVSSRFSVCDFGLGIIT